MKSTLFLVSCVFMFLFLSHIQEVDGVRPMAQCPTKQIFGGGGCRSDVNKTCIKSFVKQGGDKPISCECDDIVDEHLCRCIFNC
ncbi:hypothetical protein YC2023_095262 [Brassica napus]